MAHAPDQTEEWTAQGRIPAFRVTISADEPTTIEIADNEKGDCRGIVLVGRRWRIPTPVPTGLRLSLEFQTFCAMNDPAPRSGYPSLCLIAPARWEQFATDPLKAERWTVRADDQGIVAAYPVYSGPEDVTEWRRWQSPDLTGKMRAFAGRDLILALVWQANHFCPEWAKFRKVEVLSVSEADLDREFLQSLDLERDDLHEVKAALEVGDIPGAKAALVAHMRGRKEPVAPPLSPDGSAAGRKAADEIVDHVFRFAGCPPTKLGNDIDWGADPHHYDQWAIALNRHTHWLTLGRAYAATKDERYAREFVSELNSWIAALPIYIGPRRIEGPCLEVGKAPLSLDAGIRMGHTWWPAYTYFRDSPAFDVDSQVRMLRSFRDHARYLMQPAAYHEASNWGAMEICGLFAIAVMLPECREAKEWLITAERRLLASQKAQVYPDGAQIELSTGYHGVTLGNFLEVLRLARRQSVDLPPEFEAGLERMYEYYEAVMMPDGRYPALNDSGWGSVRGSLAQGFELFPQRADFQYLATAGKEGTPPERTSWRLPYAGWFVMRSGWGKDDNYLHFEAGPFGAGHQHEDKLSLIVHAAGKTILTEGGNYSYDSSAWRAYVLSSRAHNVVLVDGLEQNRRRRPETFVVWQPQEDLWISNPDFDCAAGTYADGFGPENALQVTHTRHVVFVKPDYWLVVDTMQPEDEKEHEYQALFHLDAETATVDEATQSVTTEWDDGGFRILPLRDDGLSASIVSGQTEPTVQGWLPTGEHGKLRAIPTAVFRWRARGPSVMAYALLPRRSGTEWPVASVQPLMVSDLGVLGVELSLPGGGKDILIRRAVPTSDRQLGRVETDADLTVIHLDAAGQPARLLQVGGTRVQLR